MSLDNERCGAEIDGLKESLDLARDEVWALKIQIRDLVERHEFDPHFELKERVMDKNEREEVERKLACAFNSDFKERLSFISAMHNWLDFTEDLTKTDSTKKLSLDQTVENVFFPTLAIEAAMNPRHLQQDVLDVLSKKRDQLVTEIVVLQQVLRPESKSEVERFQCKVLG